MINFKSITQEEGIFIKNYFADLVGTLFLVLIGCGSAVIAGRQMGFLGIAFAFGLAILAMVYAIGLALVLIHIVGIPITGTSVNPVRSFIPAPILGGILAALAW